MKFITTASAAALISLSANAQFSIGRVIEPTEFPSMGLGHVCDLNGDGANDLVVCGAMNGFASVGRYMNDGAGNFGEMILVDSAGYQGYFLSVLSADMDTDGDLDVLVIENYTRVLFLANDGLGSLAPPVQVLTAFGDMRAAAFSDLDDDGVPDLVMNEYWTDVIHWYKGVGDGTLFPAQEVASGLEGINDIALGDVDGDGDDDVMASTYLGQFASWTNNGSGVFTAQGSIASTSDAQDVDLADLDGDGDLDLIGTGEMETQVCWWANDGSGQFGSQQVIAQDVEAYQVAVGDMDGDGDLDVSSNNSHARSWFENDGSGQFVAAHPLSEAELGTIEMFDMDADGDVDVVELMRTASWYPNDGSGVMGPRRIICAQVDQAQYMDLLDLDGDGDQDILANNLGYGERVVYYLNNGDGTFGIQQILLDTLRSPQYIQTGDVDGDLDQDVLVQGWQRSMLLINDGAAHFSPGASFTFNGNNSRSPLMADLDDDGDPDIAYSDWDASIIAWHENLGGGTFGPSQTIATGFGAAEGMDACDLDGDGDLDVLSTSQLNGPLVWFQNNGGGSFASSQTIWDGSGNLTMDKVEYADVNGDGDMDVAFTFNDGIVWVENLGGGSFATEVFLTQTIEYVWMFCLEDVDLDNDPDLVYVTSQDHLICQLNDGSANFGDPISIMSTTWYDTFRVLRIADVDGDADQDLVATGSFSNYKSSLQWYENFITSPYRIEGDVFFDEDMDGVNDPGEVPLPFVMVSPTPYASSPLSDPDGHYTIYADSGSYAVELLMPDLWSVTTTPDSYNVQVNDLDPISTGNDFGCAPTTAITVLVPGIEATTAPCQDTTVQTLTVTNIGTTQPSGTFCYTLDTLFTFLGSEPPPASINGNTYCWDFDSLFFYSPDLVLVHVVNPDADAINTPMTSALVVNEEDDQGNVIHTFTQPWNTPVACAYDPNEKRVSPEGYGAAGAVDIGTEFLDFTIHFQNTGNAPAVNVMLSDDLDAYLDRNSLQVIGYSHEPTSVVIEADGEMVIRFNNIQLLDSGTDFNGSQGFFRYRLNLLPGLPHGTAITNTAAIYFDYNLPVITNTTTTTLVDCDLWSVGAITSPNWNALQAPTGHTYQWNLDGTAIPGATDQILFFTVNGEYTVEVTSIYGCVATSQMFQVTTADVDELPEVAAAAIPNPFTERTTVVFSEALSLSDQLQLIDVNGRVLRTLTGMSGNKVTIEQNGLPAGLYMLRVLRGEAPWCTVRIVAE